MNEPDNTDEFAKKLQGWHKSIKSEFDAVDAADDDAIKSLVRKKFAAAMLQMADDLVGLARGATSEAVQLSSIKFAYEFYFGKDSAKDSGFDGMLAELMNNDKS